MAEKHLHILWTNADPDTAIFMVMMYAKNSMVRQWWDKVTVIIWGATARLVAENERVQEEIRMAQKAGVRFSACVSCARQLGVISQLEQQGIEIIAWGEPFTTLIAEKKPLVSV